MSGEWWRLTHQLVSNDEWANLLAERDTLAARLASVERERDEIMAMAERREGKLQARLAEVEGALAIVLNQDGDHSPTCVCRLCKTEARLAEAERQLDIAKHGIPGPIAEQGLRYLSLEARLAEAERMKWYCYPGNCPPDIPGQVDSRCLCWIETPDGMAYIGLRAFRYVYDEYGWFSGDRRESGVVTHWMPLPSPPWVTGSHVLTRDDLPFTRVTDSAASQPTADDKCDHKLGGRVPCELHAEHESPHLGTQAVKVMELQSATHQETQGHE